eukprot:g11060.t1
MGQWRQKPISCLRKAQESLALGRLESVVDDIYDFLQNSRKVEFFAVYSDIMRVFGKTCVQLRDSRAAKDGLQAFRFLFSQKRPDVVEAACRLYLGEAYAVIEKLALSPDHLPVTPLEGNKPPGIESGDPFSLNLDGTCPSDLTETIAACRFYWESLRVVLDCLRGLQLEKAYCQVVTEGFNFCVKYNRPHELRYFSDLLSQHLNKMLERLEPNQEISPDRTQLLSSRSRARHIQVRLQQVEAAVKVSLWHTASKGLGDIVRILETTTDLDLRHGVPARAADKKAYALVGVRCPIETLDTYYVRLITLLRAGGLAQLLPYAMLMRYRVMCMRGVPQAELAAFVDETVLAVIGTGGINVHPTSPVLEYDKSYVAFPRFLAEGILPQARHLLLLCPSLTPPQALRSTDTSMSDGRDASARGFASTVPDVVALLLSAIKDGHVRASLYLAGAEPVVTFTPPQQIESFYTMPFETASTLATALSTLSTCPHVPRSDAHPSSLLKSRGVAGRLAADLGSMHKALVERAEEAEELRRLTMEQKALADEEARVAAEAEAARIAEETAKADEEMRIAVQARHAREQMRQMRRMEVERELEQIAKKDKSASEYLKTLSFEEEARPLDAVRRAHREFIAKKEERFQQRLAAATRKCEMKHRAAFVVCREKLEAEVKALVEEDEALYNQQVPDILESARAAHESHLVQKTRLDAIWTPVEKFLNSAVGKAMKKVDEAHATWQVAYDAEVAKERKAAVKMVIYRAKKDRQREMEQEQRSAMDAAGTGWRSSASDMPPA